MKNQNFKIGMKFGLIISAIGIIFEIIKILTYEEYPITDPEVIIKYLIYILLVIFIVLAHNKSYKMNSCYLSFKNALITGLFIIGIFWIINAITRHIAYEFFFEDKLREHFANQSKVSINQIPQITSLTGAVILKDSLTLLIYSILLFFTMTYEAIWMIYQKAGKKGWSSIVPVYNIIILLRIVKKPVMWIFLLFIPVINLIFAIWICNLLSLRFGKKEGFTIGLILLPFIFFPLLGLSKLKYIDNISQIKNLDH